MNIRLYTSRRLLLASAVLSLALSAAAQQTAPSANTLGQTALANQIFGHEVVSSDGQNIGNLNNLVIDLESGRILYGVIGTTKGRVGVAPELFTETLPSNNALKINATKQKIEGAPQFGPVDKPGEWGQASYIDQVYTYFGQSPWWKGNGPANVGTFHNVHKASELVGMKVENVSNQDMGKIKNVALDLPAGRVVYVVLAPASSLKLNDNYYLLPPQAVTLSPDQKNLVSDISAEKLAQAPHFAANHWPNLSDATLAGQVYQFYGKQPWFGSGGSLQPTGR